MEASQGAKFEGKAMSGLPGELGHLARWVWHLLIGIPRDLFGDRVDTGWGIVASLFVSVTAISFFIGAWRFAHELRKAMDIRFKKEKLEEYNLHRLQNSPPRKIDWVMARTQQVQALRFTFPFGVLVLASMYWWVRWEFTLRTFFVLAVCWLLFAPVLRVWWIATAVWTDRKLVKTREATRAEAPFYGISVGWAVRHYLNWGLEKSTKKQPPYIGLLRPLNPIVKMFGLRWLQIRLVKPLIVCTFFACIWAVSMPIAVFHLTLEFKRKPLLKPDWASAHATEPTYGTGAIPDTPGDARAAKS